MANNSRDLLIKLDTKMDLALKRLEYHGTVLDDIVPKVRGHATSISWMKWGLGLSIPSIVAIIAIVNFILTH